ncbi:MAG TPA: DUF3108 domain-containing protein [Steroidobacteraceae bacterium]|nr:DUF3108 domain-containing protein [Steroidobacteraceae bacterium]
MPKTRPSQLRDRATGTLLALLLALPASGPAAAGQPETGAAPAAAPGPHTAAPMQPYKVRYEASFRGIPAGHAEQSFRRGTAPGEWVYDLHLLPNLLSRIVVPESHAHATMLLTPTGVQPLTLEAKGILAASNQDVTQHFDWSRDRVSGMRKGEPFEASVSPGVQDYASVQLALITELLAGRTPGGFGVFEDGKTNDYRYWPEGRQTITTPNGPLECVVWASQGKKSHFVIRYWYAPSLGYVPVQSIRYLNGNPDLTMKLERLER